MTGGELPEEDRLAFHRLKNLIEGNEDVHRVLALLPDPKVAGARRWVYLIQTPYATFPKFVVGYTNDTNTAIERLTYHSSQWGAEASFEALTQPLAP